eukprot:2133966-Pleurochrysis_carterae.AAC.1
MIQSEAGEPTSCLMKCETVFYWLQLAPERVPDIDKAAGACGHTSTHLVVHDPAYFASGPCWPEALGFSFSLAMPSPMLIANGLIRLLDD